MFTKTKIWIILFASLFIISVGAYFFLASSGTGTVAEVWLDGELIREIDLSAVTIPYDFEVESDLGVNTVHVEHGAISVSAADCPDRLCVQQGDITDSAIPIVCMPHRLVIKIAEAEG